MGNRGQLLVGFVLLGAIVLASLFSLHWLLSQLSGASDTIKAASIAAVVSVSTFLVGRYFEKRRELTSSINKEKIRVYEKFFDIFFELFSKPNEDQSGNEELSFDIAPLLVEFHKELMFWGSDDVIEKYYIFKRSLVTEKDTSTADGQTEYLAETLTKTADLFAAMRKDIGYTFTKFNASHLAEFILDQSDPEVHRLTDRLKSRS